MDIKKFISSEKFDNNYNKLIQLELDTIKQRFNHKDTKSNGDKCLYMVSDYDFFTNAKPVFDDIDEFESLLELDQDSLVYSGPMIKRYFDPNYQSSNCLSVSNYYIVSLISSSLNIKDIVKPEYKKDISRQGFYTIRTTNSVFYLDKKTYPTLSNQILSNSSVLDRVGLFLGELWVSGMFIMEFYKKISCYDINSVDPIFGYPEDILGIYDHSENTDLSDEMYLKKVIDRVDESIQTVNRSKIEDVLIVDNNNKYTVIEYLMIAMTKNEHPVILYQMKTMFVYLANFQYFRPPFLVAKMLEFNKKYPALYSMLIEIKHRINIDADVDTSFLESAYHVDMFIIKHLIKTDDNDVFVKYISKTGIIRKFKQDSKTSNRIIDWLILFKPAKILSTLIECDILSDAHRYKVIFLTQEFSLLGKDFLSKYVLKNNKTNTNDSELSQTESETNLDMKDKTLILENLSEIINRGLTRSFYMILKLCPHILDDHINGNVLHLITSDNSIDILEIVLKKNIDVIDVKDKNGRTPLILYSELGLSNCIQKLLAYGADYELTDNKSDTFLHKLCQNGNLDIIQSTIRNVMTILNVKNDLGMTPAIEATKNGHEEIFYVLKGLNADLDETDIYNNTVYHYICSSQICPGMLILNKKNKYGVTPRDYCKLSPSYYHFQ